MMMTNFLLGQVQVPVGPYGPPTLQFPQSAMLSSTGPLLDPLVFKIYSPDLMLCSFRMYSFQDCWIASLLFSAFYTVSKLKFSKYSVSVLKHFTYGKKKLQETSADQVIETGLWVKPTLQSIIAINPLVLELSA